MPSFLKDNGNRKTIYLENTRLIFQTNFEGDPSKDKFGSNSRTATVVIQEPELAQDLINAGIRVNAYEREDRDTQYSMKLIASYRNRQGEPVQYPPEIILISGKAREVLTEETVGRLDHIRTGRIDVTIGSSLNNRDTFTNYIRTMHVYQDFGDDPLAGRFADEGYDEDDRF